jgi:hypothetical protein
MSTALSVGSPGRRPSNQVGRRSTLASWYSSPAAPRINLALRQRRTRPGPLQWVILPRGSGAEWRKRRCAAPFCTAAPVRRNKIRRATFSFPASGHVCPAPGDHRDARKPDLLRPCPDRYRPRGGAVGIRRRGRHRNERGSSPSLGRGCYRRCRRRVRPHPSSLARLVRARALRRAPPVVGGVLRPPFGGLQMLHLAQPVWSCRRLRFAVVRHLIASASSS